MNKGEVLHYPDLKTGRTQFGKNPVKEALKKAAMPLAFAGALIGGTYLSTEAISSINHNDAKEETETWSKDAKDKLNGKKPKLSQETYYKSVTVVPAGKDFADRDDNKDKPVLVWDYAATEHANGVPATAFGGIKVGEQVDGVMLVMDEKTFKEKEWGAFPCDNIKIKIQPINGKDVTIPEGSICTIKAKNIIKTDK